MSDNVLVNAATAPALIATDEVTRNGIAEQEQVVKIGLGLDGQHQKLLAAGQSNAAGSIPAVLASDQSSIPVKAVDAWDSPITAENPLPVGPGTGWSPAPREGDAISAATDTFLFAVRDYLNHVKILTLGQATEANSIPVVLPATQIAAMTGSTTGSLTAGASSLTMDVTGMSRAAVSLSGAFSSGTSITPSLSTNNGANFSAAKCFSVNDNSHGASVSGGVAKTILVDTGGATHLKLDASLFAGDNVAVSIRAVDKSDSAAVAGILTNGQQIARPGLVSGSPIAYDLTTTSSRVWVAVLGVAALFLWADGDDVIISIGAAVDGTHKSFEIPQGSGYRLPFALACDLYAAAKTGAARLYVTPLLYI